MPLQIEGPVCYKGKDHVVVREPNGWSAVPHCARCGMQYDGMTGQWQ